MKRQKVLIVLLMVCLTGATAQAQQPQPAQAPQQPGGATTGQPGNGDVLNLVGVLGALRQREETMSTGIGFGIAIPHCSSDRLDEVVAAFGRSTNGIEFDALDNAPVKFVVLFIVPKNQFQTHLRTLASIAKFLNDRSVRESLASAKSADEILSIFRERS